MWYISHQRAHVWALQVFSNHQSQLFPLKHYLFLLKHYARWPDRRFNSIRPKIFITLQATFIHKPRIARLRTVWSSLPQSSSHSWLLPAQLCHNATAHPQRWTHGLRRRHPKASSAVSTKEQAPAAASTPAPLWVLTERWLGWIALRTAHWRISP